MRVFVISPRRNLWDQKLICRCAALAFVMSLLETGVRHITLFSVFVLPLAWLGVCVSSAPAKVTQPWFPQMGLCVPSSVFVWLPVYVCVSFLWTVHKSIHPILQCGQQPKRTCFRLCRKTTVSHCNLIRQIPTIPLGPSSILLPWRWPGGSVLSHKSLLSIRNGEGLLQTF